MSKDRILDKDIVRFWAKFRQDHEIWAKVYGVITIKDIRVSKFLMRQLEENSKKDFTNRIS